MKAYSERNEISATSQAIRLLLVPAGQEIQHSAKAAQKGIISYKVQSM